MLMTPRVARGRIMLDRQIDHPPGADITKFEFRSISHAGFRRLSRGGPFHAHPGLPHHLLPALTVPP
ncbi:hypothetical protein [Pseudoroseomonas sp. WGS1072]|uniref:hypothetical protein n=1 Tax=Roseomonas sp. WGS1072 TaxID=3366816 RepID=UPI003BEF5DB5